MQKRKRYTVLLHGLLAGMLLLFGVSTISALVLIQSKQIIFSWAALRTTTPEPFPVSVNAYTKTIEENPDVLAFYTRTIASSPDAADHWWNKVAKAFTNETWYQNLATPASRIVIVWPGERKEEATKHIGDILGWNAADRAEFTKLIDTTAPIMAEGKYFPSQYVTAVDATPAQMYQQMADRFATEVIARYTPKVAAQVPFSDALTIASLLEREASDFTNMREVSGVIWNRLFTDMPLQLDATLQYARGNSPYETTWWPRIKPNDKFMSSPYNTYQHTGLPPGPISNPSAEAILAALNPIQTSCLFYFHDQHGEYHCSDTYREHVEKLQALYGQGS